MAGTVYLLHFQQPIGVPGVHQAQHYLGWADDLDERLRAHERGQGARIMAALARAGISFQLARVWSGDRRLEKRFKKDHGTGARRGLRLYCPLCSPRPINPPGTRKEAC